MNYNNQPNPYQDQPTYRPQQPPPQYYQTPPPFVPPQPPQRKPWYRRNVSIVILLFLFFPAGLYLMWRYADWPKSAKWIVSGVIAFFAIISLISNGRASQNTPATLPAPTQQAQGAAAPTANAVPTATPVPKPTATPAPVATWQTTHTYTGNGSKKTETIAVPGDWKILWSCDPASSYGGQYNIIVEVDNSDGTPADPGTINTICKSGNTSGDTEERQAGNIYLNITSEAAWTIKIQELK